MKKILLILGCLLLLIGCDSQAIPSVTEIIEEDSYTDPVKEEPIIEEPVEEPEPEPVVEEPEPVEETPVEEEPIEEPEPEPIIEPEPEPEPIVEPEPEPIIEPEPEPEPSDLPVLVYNEDSSLQIVAGLFVPKKILTSLDKDWDFKYLNENWTSSERKQKFYDQVIANGYIVECMDASVLEIKDKVGDYIKPYSGFNTLTDSEKVTLLDEAYALWYQYNPNPSVSFNTDKKKGEVVIEIDNFTYHPLLEYVDTNNYESYRWDNTKGNGYYAVEGTIGKVMRAAYWNNDISAYETLYGKGKTPSFYMPSNRNLRIYKSTFNYYLEVYYINMGREVGSLYPYFKNYVWQPNYGTALADRDLAIVWIYMPADVNGLIDTHNKSVIETYPEIGQLLIK